VNKDVKIGLVAILLLFVLLIIFWGNSTWWHKGRTATTTEGTVPTPSLSDGDLAVGNSGEDDMTRDTGHPGEEYPGSDQSSQTPGHEAVSDAPFTTLHDGSSAPLPGVIANHTPVAAFDRIADGLGHEEDASAPGDTGQVIPTSYVVKSGDTLTTIAERFYDDGTRWRLIFKANKLDDPDLLTVGSKLTIPPLKPAPSVGNSPVEPAPPVVGVGTKPGQTYIVQKNDSLGEIATRFYGTSTKWKLIAEANQIRNPRTLRIGQKLIIPPLPTGDTATTQ